MADLKTTAEERAGLRGFNTDFYAGAGGDMSVALSTRLLDDFDALLAENARLNGDLDAIAVAMGLANEHEGHVQRAGIERLCEDALAARRAESMLADVQTENARLRAVAEAAGEKKEVIAYAITHAPKGVEGGPYEAESGPPGEECDSLRDACRWPTSEPDARECAAMYLEDHLSWQGDARVIRIVRKARPSEASAVAVLRELASYPGNGGDLARIQARARRVLAAAGPDPSEVVRAALSWSEATAANGTARTVALQLACVAYRKAGGK